MPFMSASEEVDFAARASSSGIKSEGLACVVVMN